MPFEIKLRAKLSSWTMWVKCRVQQTSTDFQISKL